MDPTGGCPSGLPPAPPRSHYSVDRLYELPRKQRLLRAEPTA